MSGNLLRYFFERLYSKLENDDTILEAEIPYYDAALNMILSEYGEAQVEKCRDFIYSVFVNIVCNKKPVQLEDICKIRINLIELVPESAAFQGMYFKGNGSLKEKVMWDACYLLEMFWKSKALINSGSISNQEMDYAEMLIALMRPNQKIEYCNIKRTGTEMSSEGPNRSRFE